MALLSLGCRPGAAGDPGAAVGRVSQPIAGGYDDTADTAVVGIYDDASGARCTGALIAPNVVLTARHCVSNPAPGGCGMAIFEGPHDPKSFFVTTEPSFTFDPSDYHAVAEIVTLPLDPASADPLYSEDDLCGRDQAILILGENILPSEATPLVPRVDTPPVAGEEYSAVGFGATDDQGTGADTRRRRDGLFVACVGGACPGGPKTEWVGDEGVCQGDSGGPALDLQRRVIGVVSRGSVGCVDPVYGSVHDDEYWASWIRETVISAAAKGGYPPPPWAMGYPTDPAYGGVVGGACGVPECLSGLCLDVGQGPFCTRKCAEIAPCPEGYVCDDGVHAGLCVPPAKPEPVPEAGPEPEPDAGPAKAGDGPATSAEGCAVRPHVPAGGAPWAPLAVLVFTLGARRRAERCKTRARCASPPPSSR